MKDYWYDKVEVSIFLCPDNSDAAQLRRRRGHRRPSATQIEAQLDSMKPLVKDVFYETQERGLRAGSRTSSRTARSWTTQAGRPARVVPGQADRPEQVRRHRQLVPGRAGRRGGAGPAAAARQRCSRAERGHLVGRGLAVVMVVCAVLLIATTIRLSAFSRRRETGIMRLVGASDARHPAAVHPRDRPRRAARRRAGLRCAVGRDPVRHHRNLAKSIPITFVTTHDVVSIAPVLVGGGAVVAMATSWLTLRRYLRV